MMNNSRLKIIFNISNTLSFIRLLLVIPILLLLLYEEQKYRYFAVVIGIIAIATDGLDGYFARKYKQITNFGKIIDPVSDKICIGTITLLLVIQKIIPLWLLIVLIIRDIFILLGGFYLKKKKKFIPQSNLLGKITSGVLAFYLLIAILNFPNFYIFINVFMWLSLFFIVVSFISYASNFIKLISKIG